MPVHPGPVPVPFYGTFSLQAARIMRSRAGIHPGRLFSFQGVNVSIGMAFIASYTYWAPEDRNVSCSEKNMDYLRLYPGFPFNPFLHRQKPFSSFVFPREQKR